MLFAKETNDLSAASGNDPTNKTLLGKGEEGIEEDQRAIDQLSVFEKKFLLCAERGDVPAVRELIEKHKTNPRFNINCRDAVGRSALIVAIENENMELIDLLLNNGILPGDALLHAISEEYVEAVEVLLQHEEKTYTPGKPYSWEAMDNETSTFTRDITPLILAAHRDNYEIIKLLIDRGASLPMPHNVRCGCDECLIAVKEDCLRHSRSRINAYRALTSPSLICLSSADPIQTAFKLSRELARLSIAENEFKVDYVELRHKCEEYATALLDHTRTSYELEVMLNYDPNGPVYVKGERMKLDRLKLAIDCNQKSFVAHPNVQQLLAAVWYAGSPGFRRKNIVGQLMDISKMGLMCPVYSTAYMMAPESEMGREMKKPFTKFITHSTAYCFFLLLLIAASQRVEQLLLEFIDWFFFEKEPEEKSDRGAIPGFVESGIIFFIFGFVWAEIKQLWDGGIEEYIKDMWNVVDYFTNMLYITFIGLRACSWYIVERERAQGWPELPRREDWHPYDPLLIAEGIFGAANIFSFLKMVHIFSVNPHLGPLQISLGRMVFDIIKFFFIYTLVLFAFGCGMNQLLWYYADMDKQLCYSGPGGTQNPNYDQSCLIWRRFANLFETSQSLFWASFGLVELENFELNGIKSFTRFWSLLMFGSYSVINVVVLLNLLIAMMSNSYQIISERSDVEWKFARSKLWMSYFEEGSTVPPPFNIFPTPKFFKRMISCAKKIESSSIKAKEAFERDATYRSVMRCLIRRYVTAQQRKAEDMGVTEDDVNEVKQAVTSFRSELFDILRNNGMKGVSSTADTLSRKERLRERRLLKDFNIDLVESVMEAFMKEPAQGSTQGFGLIRRMTGKREHAKKNWNQIVGAARSRQNPIGTTAHAQSGSLKELREKVLKEQELPPMKGAKRFAHAARRVLKGKYSEAEAIEEEPGSYSATPRGSISQDEDKAKKPEGRRKSADPATKEPAPKKPAPKRDASPKRDTSPKRDASPKRDSSPKGEASPKKDVTKKSADPEKTPKKSVPKKPTDPETKAEVGKEQKKMETTPKKAPPKRVRKPSPDSASKTEAGKEPKTTPKKALPRKPSPTRGEAGKDPSGPKTTPKKVPRKPPDSAAKGEAGKEPGSEQKKMETTPKKLVPKKPTDATAKEKKKPETTTKKEAPKRPSDSTDEKQKLPPESADKGVKKTPVGSADEAMKRQKSSDVVLDIEGDTSQVKLKPTPKPAPKQTAVKLPESATGVKSLISTFDQKASASTDPAPSPGRSPAKSPARTSSAKVFPADESEPTTWI